MPREYIESQDAGLILQLAITYAGCRNLRPQVPSNRQSIAVWLLVLPQCCVGLDGLFVQITCSINSGHSYDVGIGVSSSVVSLPVVTQNPTVPGHIVVTVGKVCRPTPTPGGSLRRQTAVAK